LYLSKRIDPIMVRNGGTVGDITRALKFGAVYGLPFGQGERFGSNVNGVLDRIIGGWQIAGSARVSSGRLTSVVLTGPVIKQFDLGISKRVAIAGRVYAEIRLDALNVFNNTNFVPVTGITNIQVNNANTNRMSGSAQSAYEVTQLVGGTQARIVQLVSRIRW
jgi:hypothetical protein